MVNNDLAANIQEKEDVAPKSYLKHLGKIIVVVIIVIFMIVGAYWHLAYSYWNIDFNIEYFEMNDFENNFYSFELKNTGFYSIEIRDPYFSYSCFLVFPNGTILEGTRIVLDMAPSNINLGPGESHIWVVECNTLQNGTSFPWGFGEEFPPGEYILYATYETPHRNGVLESNRINLTIE